MTKSGLFGGAAVIAFIGALVFVPVASQASTPSSPAERAATAKLNQTIFDNNNAAEERSKQAEAQYQEAKKQNEEQQRQYQAKIQSDQNAAGK